MHAIIQTPMKKTTFQNKIFAILPLNWLYIIYKYIVSKLIQVPHYKVQNVYKSLIIHYIKIFEIEVEAITEICISCNEPMLCSMGRL
jgi:hypothetical protein